MVLYRCETWSLTLLEEYGLTVRIGWGDMDWIDLAQDRDLMEGTCEHSNNF
jgi:hypothetical protein